MTQTIQEMIDGLADSSRNVDALVGRVQSAIDEQVKRGVSDDPTSDQKPLGGEVVKGSARHRAWCEIIGKPKCDEVLSKGTKNAGYATGHKATAVVLEEVPQVASSLPPDAQELWLATYNAAVEDDDGLTLAECERVAWSVVRREFPDAVDDITKSAGVGVNFGQFSRLASNAQKTAELAAASDEFDQLRVLEKVLGVGK